MAKIPVEKKGGTPWWWWLLGLLLIIGLIWLIAELFDGDADVEGVPPVTDTMVAPPGALPPGTAAADIPGRVNEFVQFAQADTAEVEADMGLQHEYTSRGLELLAGALSAVVNQYDLGDIQMEAQRDTLTQRVEAIQQDPMSTQHANKVRDAFLSVADLMESIQQKRFPDAAQTVSQVRQSAESISETEPLLEQSEDVRTFFDRAADALQRISGPTAGTS